MTVSILAILATAGLALALWRLDRKRSRLLREFDEESNRISSQRSAVDGLLSAVDGLNLEMIAVGCGLDVDFREAIQPDMDVFDAKLSMQDKVLAALVRGELD